MIHQKLTKNEMYYASINKSIHYFIIHVKHANYLIMYNIINTMNIFRFMLLIL